MMACTIVVHNSHVNTIEMSQNHFEEVCVHESTRTRASIDAFLVLWCIFLKDTIKEQSLAPGDNKCRTLAFCGPHLLYLPDVLYLLCS